MSSQVRFISILEKSNHNSFIQAFLNRGCSDLSIYSRDPTTPHDQALLQLTAVTYTN